MDTWATKTERPQALDLSTAHQEPPVQQNISSISDVLVETEDEVSVEALDTDASTHVVRKEDQPTTTAWACVLPAPEAAAPQPSAAMERGMSSVEEDRSCRTGCWPHAGDTTMLQPMPWISQTSQEEEAPLQRHPREDTPTHQALPRQQREEAAKLAETRRRFDNQRYQQMPANKAVARTVLRQSRTVETLPEEEDAGGDDTKVLRRASALGISLKIGGGVQQEEAQLPGGVVDSGSMSPVVVKSHTRSSSSQRAPHGKQFDADDEALMAEIIDELGSV